MENCRLFDFFENFRLFDHFWKQFSNFLHTIFSAHYPVIRVYLWFGFLFIYIFTIFIFFQFRIFVGALKTKISKKNHKKNFFFSNFQIGVCKIGMSNLIPGYKRHSLDEFSSDVKRLRTQNRQHHSGDKKTRGRVKIKIEFIQDKQKRCTTFSKRKAGLMKKSHELATLTGSQVKIYILIKK